MVAGCRGAFCALVKQATLLRHFKVIFLVSKGACWLLFSLLWHKQFKEWGLFGSQFEGAVCCVWDGMVAGP